MSKMKESWIHSMEVYRDPKAGISPKKEEIMDKYKEIKALTDQDREEIHEFAMKRSREMLSETDNYKFVCFKCWEYCTSEECPDCGGRTIEEDPTKEDKWPKLVSCPDCKGRGWDEYNHKDCPDCAGKGFQPSMEGEES